MPGAFMDLTERTWQSYEIIGGVFVIDIMKRASWNAVLSTTYDLVVVGSSFASSFFLKKYLEYAQAHARVLVLERGEYIPHTDRLLKAKHSRLGDVSFISGGDARKTYTNESPAKPWIFDPSFGGSSNCWTGCTPRFMPNDFRMKSTYDVGEDWPLSYDELEEFYCEAESIMAISGPAVTPYPMSKKYPQRPHSLSTVDKVMQQHYGEQYISQPTARSSEKGKRNACCSSAICHLCPTGAKFTVENGMMQVFEDPRVEICFDTQVLRLETEGRRVRKVIFATGERELKVKTDAVALGANAIFNAHILLHSGDTNSFTGHYLSEQVGYYALVMLDGLQNTGGSSIITANGFMLHDGPHRADRAACIIESHNDFFIRHEHGKWRNVAKFKFVFEDIPQFDNCVRRAENRRVPEVHYASHSDYVTRGHEGLQSEIEKILGVLPVEAIYLDDRPQASESHILGTTRMSKDASNGVVDKHLIHHSYRNLFVLGGSTFPTISPCNPTLTLSALSLWAAEKEFGRRVGVKR
jgi:choline dehydrogenase-like flavoprotein